MVEDVEKKSKKDNVEGYKEKLKEISELIGLEERGEDEVLDSVGIVSIIHLIRCGIDVARQYKEIDNVNDLIIHPISTTKPDCEEEGHELLLKHVSDALRLVIKELDVSFKINTRGGTVYDPEYQ